MVDLHTHTNHSDGTWSLEKLLENAEKSKVTVLSITDHDNVKAYKKLREIDHNSIFSGKIITGGEFHAVFNNSNIELLGYDFDVDYIDEWSSDTYTINDNELGLNEEFNCLMNACYKNKIKVDDIKYEPSMGWPIDFVFDSLKKYPENKQFFFDKEWNDVDHFFKCCKYNIDFPLYINFSNHIPDAKLVAKTIRDAGGKVFIAHLYKYPLRDYIAYLDKLREEDIIDGIEVYHSKFDDAQVKFLEDYCKKHNLLMSGGTDCHGDKKAERKIGTGFGDMNISEDIIKNWIN